MVAVFVPEVPVYAPDHAPVPTSDHDTVERLVHAYAPAARSMAARYRRRGIDIDDLEQVALLALTRAAQRFDPSAGHPFLAYAAPTVRGELRKHFRDVGWVIRPPRRIQEVQGRVGAAQEALAASLGRSPRPSEVAEHLGEPLADVVEALAADGCFAPTSLDLVVGGGSSTIGDLVEVDDHSLRALEARVVLEPLVRTLAPRDRRIVRLRFVEELNQREIAEQVGLTQAQVSRVLTRILATLRDGLGEPVTAA